jgi:tellurite resistance protein
VKLRELPIGFYGAVMGLVGLGLALRAAAPLFPGVVRAPVYVTEPWIWLGALAFLFLLPAYMAKLVLHPDAVGREFTNPLQFGFCGALPVGMGLLAGGLGPYWAALGDVLWWIAFALMVAFQTWALIRLLHGGIELAQVNGGWLIILVGGIVLPGPGLSLGHDEASRFVFGISAVAAAVLVPILLYRAMAAPPLPEVLRPSWFILLVPPSLIYANGVALYPDAVFLEAVYGFGVILAVALIVYARGMARWAFGPPWWAFTFPLDALAYAAVRYAQQHPAPVWRALAAAALLLAAFFVLLVLWRTLRSAASRPA